MTPTNLIQWMPRTLPGCIFAILLAVLVAGCGGGPGDGELPEVETITASRVIDIVARTGPIVAVRVGQTAVLSDLNSYTTSTQPLSFHWSFTSEPDASNAASSKPDTSNTVSSKPDTSNAVLQNANTPNPSFVADAKGTYMVQLVVSAEGLYSQRAVQLVVATVSPEDPTGPANHEGLSSTCVNCHSDEIDASPGPGKIPGKSPNHVATSSMCETCHTPLGFDIIPFVDHQEVFGNCSECHNGVLAVGKSEFHQPTSAECDDCHNTTSFLTLNADGSFDHTGINRSCSGCHNGTVSIGKTPTPPHPDTNVECGNCHTTESFLGAYPDHTGPLVVGPGITCDSCHGDTAIGPPNGHPVPAVDCGTCHSIVRFNMDGVFNHRVVDAAVQACESCHNETNSIKAPAKSAAVPEHLATTTDCGSCHNTDSFSPAFGIDHTDPAVLNARCDSCHGNTVGPVNASGKSPNHLPTTDDCKDCHTPGTFTTGVFSHGPSYIAPPALCTNCHNEVITGGKRLNHFPTPLGANQDCADCHNTTNFAGVPFDHLNIDPSDCAQCHNGNFETTGDTLYGKPNNHLPVGQEDCSVCHTTNAPFWQVANFAHPNIVDNCESCHNGNPDFVAFGAIGKKVNHIPALGQCLTCHNDTSNGGFASPNRFLNNVHDNITDGCEGCHVSRFLAESAMTPTGLIKDVNHLPTGQDCDLCHTVAGFGPPTTFAHLGITGNCVSCHDGTYDPDGPTNPLGPSGKAADLSGHVVTSADCGSCHNTDSFKPAFAIDHTDPTVLARKCDSCHNGTDATGKMDAPSTHVPTTQDCGVCHVAGGTFAPAVFNHTGIVDNCASCHDTNPVTAKPKSGNHIVTSEDCSVCHNTTDFAGARFDHQLVGINDSCASCHNGKTTIGKPTRHVPTNGDCRDCHQTTGFKPATFDHVGIVDNCASCHAAGFATPKKVNHVDTNQDCGVCHNTSVFKPATFDHTGITNNCASCHDGTTATGKQDADPAHIDTSLDCSSCHTTATFAGGTWTHDSSSANNCDTCHSPTGGATFKSGGHLSTNEQCDVCHTTNGWAPTNFRHSSQGNYPGDHRRDPGCNGCHKGSIGAGINSGNYPNQLRYAPFCAGCHANDFESEGDHIGGKNGTIEQNKNCAGSGCHRVSDSDFD